MKRSRSILSILLLLAMLAAAASACADGTLTLPSGVRVIESAAFSADGAFDDVVLPEGIERIESAAFANSGVKHITLPASLTFIAADAFSGCEGLAATVQPGSYALKYCTDNGIPVQVEGADSNVLVTSCLSGYTLYDNAGFSYIDTSLCSFTLANDAQLVSVQSDLAAVYGLSIYMHQLGESSYQLTLFVQDSVGSGSVSAAVQAAGLPLDTTIHITIQTDTETVQVPVPLHLTATPLDSSLIPDLDWPARGSTFHIGDVVELSLPEGDWSYNIWGSDKCIIDKQPNKIVLTMTKPGEVALSLDCSNDHYSAAFSEYLNYYVAGDLGTEGLQFSADQGPVDLLVLGDCTLNYDCSLGLNADWYDAVLTYGAPEVTITTSGDDCLGDVTASTPGGDLQLVFAPAAGTGHADVTVSVTLGSAAWQRVLHVDARAGQTFDALDVRLDVPASAQPGEIVSFGLTGRDASFFRLYEDLYSDAFAYKMEATTSTIAVTTTPGLYAVGGSCTLAVEGYMSYYSQGSNRNYLHVEGMLRVKEPDGKVPAISLTTRPSFVPYSADLGGMAEYSANGIVSFPYDAQDAGEKCHIDVTVEAADDFPFVVTPEIWEGVHIEPMYDAYDAAADLPVSTVTDLDGTELTRQYFNVSLMVEPKEGVTLQAGTYHCTVKAECTVNGQTHAATMQLPIWVVADKAEQLSSLPTIPEKLSIGEAFTAPVSYNALSFRMTSGSDNIKQERYGAVSTFRGKQAGTVSWIITQNKYVNGSLQLASGTIEVVQPEEDLVYSDGAAYSYRLYETATQRTLGDVAVSYTSDLAPELLLTGKDAAAFTLSGFRLSAVEGLAPGLYTAAITTVSGDLLHEVSLTVLAGAPIFNLTLPAFNIPDYYIEGEPHPEADSFYSDFNNYWNSIMSNAYSAGISCQASAYSNQYSIGSIGSMCYEFSVRFSQYGYTIELFHKDVPVLAAALEEKPQDFSISDALIPKFTPFVAADHLPYDSWSTSQLFNDLRSSVEAQGGRFLYTVQMSGDAGDSLSVQAKALFLDETVTLLELSIPVLAVPASVQPPKAHYDGDVYHPAEDFAALTAWYQEHGVMLEVSPWYSDDATLTAPDRIQVDVQYPFCWLNDTIVWALKQIETAVLYEPLPDLSNVPAKDLVVPEAYVPVFPSFHLPTSTSLVANDGLTKALDSFILYWGGTCYYQSTPWSTEAGDTITLFISISRGNDSATLFSKDVPVLSVTDGIAELRKHLPTIPSHPFAESSVPSVEALFQDLYDFAKGTGFTISCACTGPDTHSVSYTVTATAQSSGYSEVLTSGTVQLGAE